MYVHIYICIRVVTIFHHSIFSPLLIRTLFCHHTLYTHLLCCLICFFVLCLFFSFFLCLYEFRFELPGVPQGIRLSQEFDKNPEYKYFGRGLNEGECGISIERVKPNNNGKVKCILGLAEDEVSNEIDLTVACK